MHQAFSTTLTAIALFFNGNYIAVKTQVDAGFGYFCGGEIPNILIKTTQEQRAPVELGGLGTQAIKNAGKFNSDIAATDDQHTLWKFR